MKKFLLIVAAAGLFISCDHSTEKTTHSSHDSVGHDMHADTSSVGGASMQQVMNDMMTVMHQQKSTGSSDVDFAQMMMAHHQGAVKMAEMQISQGRHEVLKEFSRNVVKTQSAEIDSFQRFLAATSPVMSDKPSPFFTASEASMKAMMSGGTHQAKDVDTDFAELMIPHHQSAVDMAKAYLKVGTDARLKKISEAIVESQAKEIDWLKQWLNNKK